MSGEDDTYSTIFTALKHPIRRKILRRLQAGSASYTDLLNDINIENGLLNYHLDNIKDLVTKQLDGRYFLNEFGLASVQLLQRVEEPIAESTASPRRVYTRLILVLSVLIIVALSGATLHLYLQSQDMDAQISRQQSQTDQTNEYLQSFYSLFDANITPPVTKAEAVFKALSRSGYNSTTLQSKVISANLDYVRLWSAGTSHGFTWISRVTIPVIDYSPQVSYNVTITNPGSLPKATVWYRYVWTVKVRNPPVINESGFIYVTSGDTFYVDAGTGELVSTGITFLG